MNCGFCHQEIALKVGAPDGESSCGSCLGGCRKIHCPHCGYANPAPGKFLSRFLGKKEKDK
ncbi:MAG: hypothetical protein KAG12_00370 [Desulfuromusa sp.]|nr:hypothetical protein [Desulfuromusa sp.]